MNSHGGRAMRARCGPTQSTPIAEVTQAHHTDLTQCGQPCVSRVQTQIPRL